MERTDSESLQQPVSKVEQSQDCDQPQVEVQEKNLPLPLEWYFRKRITLSLLFQSISYGLRFIDRLARDSWHWSEYRKKLAPWRMTVRAQEVGNT